MLPTFITVFATVFIAELVGDKTLYTLGSLSARFRVAPIMLGATVAFMLKMLAAVLLGQILARLPAWVIATTSALVFFAMAVAMMRERPNTTPNDDVPRQGRYAAGMAFAAIALSEWGDPGQLAAAAFVAQGRPLLAVWSGATLAVITKALLASLMGKTLRQWVPSSALRFGAAAVCATMGILAAFQIEL